MSDLSLDAAPARQADFKRWRRRSRLIHTLRIAFPVTIGLIFAGLGGSVAYNTIVGGAAGPKESKTPIRMVNPRFVGRDDKGRPFVLTAISATRDDNDFQKVLLNHPALVTDEGGPDQMRVLSVTGVYHEADRKLDMSGGVRASGTQAAFETAESMFDTKTGELVGPSPIQGAGTLGEISAKSYGVTGKGDRIIFQGGVHTRMNKKQAGG